MCLLMESNTTNGNNQKIKMSLVLSTDAKPRLKWTSELHHRFIEAVNQLGGPNKATPKGLMKAMEIPGLTLYHLKSHLQKYRLGKSLKFDDNKLEVSSASETQEAESKNDSTNIRGSVNVENNNPANEGVQITEALQLQMEVQKKLHEQIEVQKHLQVKIEAQGKYLQSVLLKAQQTLAGYTSSTLGMDFARTELSRLASMVNQSSSFSELTQVEEVEEEGFLWCKKQENRGVTQPRRSGVTQPRRSVESSLTSSESSETKLNNNNEERVSVELPLMEIKSQVLMEKKRSLNDVVCVERQPPKKRNLGAADDDDDDDEHLRLSLNSYKKDMETCPNIGLGFN